VTGNVLEDFKIKSTNGANGWTIGSSPGTNIFKVESDLGDNGSYETVLTTGDQSFVSALAVGGTQTFGLKYSAPTLDTQGGNTSHDFTITITASKTP
jgi:hypothetical protein